MPPRLKWVEAFREFAVIIDEGENGYLIRYATKPSGYHWVSRRQVTRRPDLDGRRQEPDWLTRARASPRPGILRALLDDDSPPAPRHHDFDTDPNGRVR